MGVVRPVQGKLQEALDYFGKRVARLALFRCKCPRCTSGVIKCTSAKALAPRLNQRPQSTPWYLLRVSKTKAVEVEVVLAPLQGLEGDHFTSAVGAGAHHVR